MKLLPPLFRPGAAVVSEKIDEVAEQVHAALDGGLDADNLAGAYVLPVGSFLENRALLVLRGDAIGGIDGPGGRLIAKLPFEARLIGFAARFYQGGAGVRGKVGVLADADVLAVSEIATGETTSLWLPIPAVVPAGAKLYGATTVNLVTATVPAFMTLYLDLLHVG